MSEKEVYRTLVDAVVTVDANGCRTAPSVQNTRTKVDLLAEIEELKRQLLALQEENSRLQKDNAEWRNKIYNINAQNARQYRYDQDYLPYDDDTRD